MMDKTAENANVPTSDTDKLVSQDITNKTVAAENARQTSETV